MPLSIEVSTAFANPFVPKVAKIEPEVATTAFCIVDELVPEAIVDPTKLMAVPEVSIVLFTPASKASAQPSPSESKSKRLGMPSLSVSISTAPHNTLNSPKNIL